MADPVDADYIAPPDQVGPMAFAAKRTRQRLLAIANIRRRRRILAPIGAAAQQPIQQTTVPKVGMRHDAWKKPVRVATTANVSLATALAAGQTIDGVTLATDDRVLVMAQTDQKQNGIYVSPASGAALRADDAEIDEHFRHAVVGVLSGTVNAKHIFVCFSNTPIIVGSSNIAWTDISTFLGAIDGAIIDDGTIPLTKLISGFDGGEILYFDKDDNQWHVLLPPGAKSVLTHDGGTGDPYWEAV